MRYRIVPFFSLLLVLLAMTGTVAAETQITLQPEKAMVGETIDVSVQAGNSALSVIYSLSRDGSAVFSGKEDTHFHSAFRPRQEGVYTLEARVQFADGSVETAQASVAVSGQAQTAQGPETVYSQKDGWWKDKVYSKSDLDNAGCAIFTLSHALQRMGWKGEEFNPENLAVTYRKCYTKNGTAVARLIYQASQAYGFTTKTALFKQQTELRESLKNGDYFSFAIVLGHIALMDGIDPQGKKVHIVDSAPSATFERIKKGSVYYLKDGEYVEAADPGEIPGARYYFETGYYGGLEYYMDLEYCARRGGRLIRPSWLFHQGTDGKIGAVAVRIGIGDSDIAINGKESTVPTRELRWGDGETPRLAAVTEKKNIRLQNAEGKRIGTVPPCVILPVLREEDDRVLVLYDENRGYVNKSEIELLEPLQGAIRKGTISVNGSTSGRATVKMRFGPSEKHKIMANWKTGTDVTILGKQDDFWQVEGQGLRVWVHQDYLTAEEGEENAYGTEINEGE